MYVQSHDKLQSLSLCLKAQGRKQPDNISVASARHANASQTDAILQTFKKRKTIDCTTVTRQTTTLSLYTGPYGWIDSMGTRDCMTTRHIMLLCLGVPSGKDTSQMISDMIFMIPARMSPLGVSEGVHSVPQDEHKPEAGQQNDYNNTDNKHKHETKDKIKNKIK